MKKIKLEHIDRLSRGKRSGAHIGSRAVGHHLRAHERLQYERALKMGYLEITDQDRENLWNLWEKVCIAKDTTFLVLVKNLQAGSGSLYVDGKKEQTVALQEAKILAKEMVS